MNTNLFFDVNRLFLFRPFALIREYSCSFVAEVLFLDLYTFLEEKL